MIDTLENKVVKCTLDEMIIKVNKDEISVANLEVLENSVEEYLKDEWIEEVVVVGGRLFIADRYGLRLAPEDGEEKIEVELEKDMRLIIGEGVEGKDIEVRNATVALRDGLEDCNIVLKDCILNCIDGNVGSLTVIGGEISEDCELPREKERKKKEKR